MQLVGIHYQNLVRSAPAMNMLPLNSAQLFIAVYIALILQAMKSWIGPGNEATFVLPKADTPRSGKLAGHNMCNEITLYLTF